MKFFRDGVPIANRTANTKHSRRFKRKKPIGEDDSLAYTTSCPVLNANKVPLTDMRRHYYLKA